MKRFKCSLGFHDWYAVYPPLILMVKQGSLMETAAFQYVTVKRICVQCKHREEYLVKLSGKLAEWDVVQDRVAS